MDVSTTPTSQVSSVPILWRGRWHAVDRQWIAERERYGLTPTDYETIALAGYAGPLGLASRSRLLMRESGRA